MAKALFLLVVQQYYNIIAYAFTAYVTSIPIMNAFNKSVQQYLSIVYIAVTLSILLHVLSAIIMNHELIQIRTSNVMDMHIV